MASGVISDFAEVVALQSEYDDVRIHVHKDIITQRSLRIRRELTSDNVFHCSHPYPGSTDVAESLDALKPYITWCYTGSVSDGLALRDLTEDWLVVFAEYKTALWLLDAQYANAILDKWAEQDFDAGTLISHCREMIQHGLQGSKLWQWYVDCLAAKMSTKDFVRVGGERKTSDGIEKLPRVLLEDVLLEMTRCREHSKALVVPTAADREKYHMSEETVEEFWENWLEHEDEY